MPSIVAMTVIIGILVLIVDFMLVYGGILFWSEERRAMSVVFFLTVIVMTAFYVDIVMGMCIE